MKRFARPLSIAGMAALTACGGGGGGSGGNPPGFTTGPLAITASNYVQAGQEAMSSAYFLLDTGDFATAAQLSVDTGPMRFSRAQIAQLSRWFATATRVATGVTQTSTEACSGGGSVTVTVNDVNGNDKLDVGDGANLVANSCAFGSEFVSGEMTVLVTTLTGNLDTTVYKVSMSITMNNLVISSAAGSNTATGRMEFGEESIGLNNTITTLGVSSLSATASFAGSSSTRTLSDFTLREALTPSGLGPVRSLSVTGTLASSALDSKSIALSTVSPFVRSNTARYPASGQALITGANGSKARLTAQSATTVFIEVDADGNGSYETSATRLWSQLL